jgi:hypothetical protein
MWDPIHQIEVYSTKSKFLMAISPNWGLFPQIQVKSHLQEVCLFNFKFVSTNLGLISPIEGQFHQL